MYEEMPKGVVFPESGEDIAFLVRQAAKENGVSQLVALEHLWLGRPLVRV